MKAAIITILFLSFAKAMATEDPYRLGSTWGRKAYTSKNRSSLPRHLRRQALSVAKFRGGTAFYLGKVDERHLMATNYHVLPTALNCYSLNRADFVLLEASFKCKKFIASFSSIELSLFEIEVPKTKESILEGLGIRMADTDPTGPLFGLGYGRHLNPHPTRRSLLLSHDRYCRPFTSELRYISDPDLLNPVDYKVWSIPIGCDFSHGDSGSPVFDSRGTFTGIYWTGATPKASHTQNDEYLENLLRSPDERVWGELSYMVPSSRIRSELEVFLEENPDHVFFNAIFALLEGVDEIAR